MMLGGLAGLCHGGLHSGTDFQMVIHLNHLLLDIIFSHITILEFLLEFAVKESAGVVRGCGHVNSPWHGLVQSMSIHTKHNSEQSKLPVLFESSIAITLPSAQCWNNSSQSWIKLSQCWSNIS